MKVVVNQKERLQFKVLGVYRYFQHYNVVYQKVPDDEDGYKGFIIDRTEDHLDKGVFYVAFDHDELINPLTVKEMVFES